MAGAAESNLDTILGVSVYHLEQVFLQDVCSAADDKGIKLYSRSSKIHEIENLQGPPGFIRQKGIATVCPVDGKLKTAYVNCLTGDDHVGEATHMLSYSWSYAVGDIVDALCDYCESHNLNPRRTYVWICCLCINQHRVVEAKEEGGTGMLNFEEEFPIKLKKIGHMLAMLTPWEAPVYLTRLWCIFEFFAAIVNDVPINIIVPHREAERMAVELLGREGVGVDALYAALQSIDIQHAHATVDSDREKILGLVEQSVGFHEVNRSVGEHFRSWVKGILTRLVGSYLVEQQGGQVDLDPLTISSVWARLGKLLSKVGDYKLALKCYEQAVMLREAHLEEDNPETAALYDSIGSVLFHSGQQEQATQMGKKCLNIRLSRLGMEHPTTALSYRSMGLYLMASGKNKAALIMLQKCQAIQEKNPTSGLVLSETYSAISTVLQRKKQHSQAVGMQKKALDCIASVSSPDHPRMATAYHSLGSALMFSGTPHLNEALQFFQKSLEIREIALGNSHPDTASTHSSIAHVLQKKGDYEGALEAFEQCRSMQEKYLSPEHPDTALTYNALAIVLGNLGNITEARRYHDMAERTLVASLGETHPLTLQSRRDRLTTTVKLYLRNLDGSRVCSRCVDLAIKIAIFALVAWAAADDNAPAFFQILLWFFMLFFLVIFIAGAKDVLEYYWRVDWIQAPEMTTPIRAVDNDDLLDDLELGPVVGVAC